MRHWEIRRLPETWLGLRIDVDTYRGTKKGVPNLQKILLSQKIAASFFFCTGPDNMGRHILKMLKPGFLKKMMRSNAPNLYGWDIILKGTLLPGPVIGKKCADIIRSVAQDGHEIGLHAWDHYEWQSHMLNMAQKQILDSMQKGCDGLEAITGRRPLVRLLRVGSAMMTSLKSKKILLFHITAMSGGLIFFFQR